MSTQERDKIIERVKILLAMGGDVSSPNEAAIALKRARALMDKHQIKMMDIDSWDDDDSLGQSSFHTGTKKGKRWLGWLAVAVAKLNDCQVTHQYYDKEGTAAYHYIFSGFAEDVSLCEFMMAYLNESCETLFKRDKKELGIVGVAGKNSYMTGIAMGIIRRIQDIIKEREDSPVMKSDGTSLMVVKAQIVEERYGEVKYARVKSATVKNADAFNAGKKASKEVHLGSFVGGVDTSDMIAN